MGQREVGLHQLARRELAGAQARRHLPREEARRIAGRSRSGRLVGQDGGHHEVVADALRARRPAPRPPAGSGPPGRRAGCSRARSSGPWARCARCRARPAPRTARGCGSAGPAGAPARHRSAQGGRGGPRGRRRHGRDRPWGKDSGRSAAAVSARRAGRSARRARRATPAARRHGRSSRSRDGPCRRRPRAAGRRTTVRRTGSR